MATYDGLVTALSESLDADGVLVVVSGGAQGNGSSSAFRGTNRTTRIATIRMFARGLRQVADQLEAHAEAEAAKQPLD